MRDDDHVRSVERGPRAMSRSSVRRVERWTLGLAMTVVAFVIERRVLRSIKRKGEQPPTSPGSAGTAGVGVDPPE
jgi:hypothetical protein